MDTNEVIRELRQLVDTMGSQQAAALRMGVGASYFSDLLRGRREPGPKVLKALGLVRTYQRISEKKAR